MMERAYQQLLNNRGTEKRIKETEGNKEGLEDTLLYDNFFPSRTTTSPQKIE